MIVARDAGGTLRPIAAARRAQRVAALASASLPIAAARSLAAAPAFPNPYPLGVSVAGTGSSAPWKTGFYVPAGLWVANTGFGVAPIYRDADFARIWDSSTIVGPALGVGSDSFGPSLIGPAGANRRITLLGSVDDTGSSVYAPGDSVAITTSATGWQRIDYAKDGSGWWVPSAAQGGTAGGATLFDHLIQIGAIVFAAIATAGATGVLGPTTAGPGAEAIGGSAAIDVGAPVALVPAAPTAGELATPIVDTTPPEIATFTPPAIAPPPVVDVAPVVNVAQAGSVAAAAATDPLAQVFSITKYINTLASAYKTVASLTAGTTHPQAGTRTRLPDGSVSVVNPDGSTTVVQPDGTSSTVSAGGVVSGAGAGGGSSLGWILALAVGAALLGGG